MKDTSIVGFVKTYIEDDYAMNVFYNIIKKSFVENDFTLSNMSSFKIDGRFFGEEMNINFRTNRFKNNKYALSLMLSVRLLMLNHNYIKLCEDDDLMFMPKPAESFLWIGYMSFILENMDDNEVKMLYSMFETVYFRDDLTEEYKRLFKDSITIPAFKNERAYYKSLAKNTVGFANGVISNCAFIEASFNKFVIQKDIKYVGDTAFAFCANLDTLVFEDKVMFGKFPIIECEKLRQIVVPTSLLDYYKENLLYYKDIICDKEKSVQDAKEARPEKISNSIEFEKKKGQMDFKKLDLVFDKKVTSYKYFWFISIISLAKDRGTLVIPFKDILIRMAALAWPIVLKDEIILSKQDMLPKYLNDISNKTSLLRNASWSVVERHLTQHFDSKGIEWILSPLLNNVPYRFLSPWIPFTTNEEVAEKSIKREYACLYALHDNAVVLDEDWWNYIHTNYSTICEYAKNSFVKYVKTYNNQIKLLRFMTVGWF